MKYGKYGQSRVFNISIKVDEALHTKLVEHSAELGVSKSEVIRRAVMKYRPTKKEREAATRE